MSKIYTSDKFIVIGGTSSQFLKANGSVDNTVYAPINNPIFTGTASATTAPLGTNTTQLATTEFVSNANALKADLVDSKVPLNQLPTKTITTTVPSGIPADGDEWIIY